MKIVYTKPDGGIAVVTAASKTDLEGVFGSLTEQQYRDHVLSKSIPEGASNVRVMPDDWTPPEDRSFRNAWRMNGKSIAVDMPMARDIHRNRLRMERNKRLAELDIEAMRALEAGGDIKAVTAAKQRLRDAPSHPAIEAAQTPDELKAITLDML